MDKPSAACRIPGGSGPIWYYESCVEYYAGDTNTWENLDWGCSASYYDGSPLICGLAYRTAILYTYYGYWNWAYSPVTVLC